MESFKLKAKSSKGGYYSVTIDIGENIRISCDCSAGVFGKLCKHKLGFLAGDKNYLYDKNDDLKLNEVLLVVKRSEYSSILNQLTSAEANVEEAKNKLTKVKGKLEKTLKEGIKLSIDTRLK